jgi:hypothetical protein
VLFSAHVLEEPVQDGAKPRPTMRRTIIHIGSAAIAAQAAVAGVVAVDPVQGAITAQLRLLRPLRVGTPGRSGRSWASGHDSAYTPAVNRLLLHGVDIPEDVGKGGYLYAVA